MDSGIYHELTPWYLLLDAREDHEEEAQDYAEIFTRVVRPEPRTLLELGAGAGNNGFYLKRHFHCTLSDLSAPMLELSREVNPECDHVQGDMRTLRLGQTFDAVLIHDAVVYMTTEGELSAAAATAYAHTRSGGAALFVPDCLRETFVECTDDHEGENATHGFRAVEWMWDPDPQDTTYTVDYAFLLRDHTGVRAVHDRHIEGLFPRTTWISVLAGVGYRVESIPRPIAPEDNPSGAYCEEMFLCIRD